MSEESKSLVVRPAGQIGPVDVGFRRATEEKRKSEARERKRAEKAQRRTEKVQQKQEALRKREARAQRRQKAQEKRLARAEKVSLLREKASRAKQAETKARYALIDERLRPVTAASEKIGRGVERVGGGLLRGVERAFGKTMEAGQHIVVKTAPIVFAPPAVSRASSTAFYTLLSAPSTPNPAWGALESSLGYGSFTREQAIFAIMRGTGADRAGAERSFGNMVSGGLVGSPSLFRSIFS